jgi:hypothetical protein
MLVTGEFVENFQTTCSMVAQFKFLLISFAHSDNVVITCFIFSHASEVWNIPSDSMTFAIQTGFVPINAGTSQGGMQHKWLASEMFSP